MLTDWLLRQAALAARLTGETVPESLLRADRNENGQSGASAPDSPSGTAAALDRQVAAALEDTRRNYVSSDEMTERSLRYKAAARMQPAAGRRRVDSGADGWSAAGVGTAQRQLPAGLDDFGGAWAGPDVLSGVAGAAGGDWALAGGDFTGGAANGGTGGAAARQAGTTGRSALPADMAAISRYFERDARRYG